MGPFKIIRQMTPVFFDLALPNHYCVSPTFHVSLLKPAVGPIKGGEEVPPDQGPLPTLVESEEAYQVRELHDSRRWG